MHTVTLLSPTTCTPAVQTPAHLRALRPTKERAAIIAREVNEWYDREYGDLPLPWEAYEIHHILPEEFESIMNSPLTLQQVNTLDRKRFVVALASLFEGPPWIVEQAWQARPFSTLTDLHRALCEVMMQAPVEQQVALIQAHPDLVGRAALAGTLTAASTNEQASAGLDRLSAEEIAAFARYNQAYRERFGFPFVICARENKKESILAGFATRLHHNRDQEIEIALGEIARICWLRLQDTFRADGDNVQ